MKGKVCMKTFLDTRDIGFANAARVRTGGEQSKGAH